MEACRAAEPSERSADVNSPPSNPNFSSTTSKVDFFLQQYPVILLSALVLWVF